MKCLPLEQFITMLPNTELLALVVLIFYFLGNSFIQAIFILL